MGTRLDRKIDLKTFRERHRAAYRAAAALGAALLCFVLLLDLALLASAFSPGLKARIVGSGSMQPTIGTGSIVVTRPRGEYAAGDVIIFDDPLIGPNMHRIVEVREIDGSTWYVTKGDAYDEPDRLLVPFDKVEGKVELAFPYLGYAAYAGFFAALIPVTLMVLGFFRRRGHVL